MDITVCIPVLNNYLGLEREIASLENGSITPTQYLIIDNGGKLEKIFEKATIYRPESNIGVAASWNWFIKNSTDIRLICNDDLLFEKHNLELLRDGFVDNKINTPANLSGSLFSCFMLPDKVVEIVGFFDESISPNYGYFEDNDYYYRAKLLGLQEINFINALISHNASTTLHNFDQTARRDHHERFKLAEKNYVKKWGGLPTKERFTIPYNGQ